MKDREKTDELRNEYVSTLAFLAGLATDRATHIPGDAGYGSYRTSAEAAESKAAVEKINLKIAETCNKLRSIEQRARGCIGIPALLGEDVPNAIRLVLAILAGKSLSGYWSHETHHVGAILLPAGGTDPQDLITVREAFRKSGCLRPHIRFEAGRTLDEMSNLTLTETAFRQFLALEPDSECDDVVRAREMIAQLGRR
jgi:hypothetical protein